jgi:hypothetical protein
MLPGLLQQAHKVKYFLNENSTTLLTTVGVTGTVATAYLTGRASFKAAEIIAREEETLEVNGDGNVIHEIPRIEKAKMVWRHYLPAAAVGILTVTSIVMANRISSKRIAALVIASGISDRALQEYKAKVIQKFGERKEVDIRDEIAQDKVNANPPDTRQVFVHGTGEVLCFDTLTGRYFSSTVEKIRRAENRVNYELLHYFSASLTMFYEEIGLPPTDYTDSVGWNTDNLLEVNLSTVMSQDEKPCIAVSFVRNPVPNYDKHWG